ncbi:MAG: urease accessory protein UreH [Aridibacter sp.]
MAISTLSILFFGFLLGLKHAVEADHIAAVSTIVTERKSLWSSAIIGGIWGLGHTISLLAVGILVILLEFRVSSQMENILEFFVGIMLLFLGINVIQKMFRGGQLHFHKHEHGEHLHAHPHLHEDIQAANEPHTHHGFSLAPRPLIIGMVHGLAGSAGLMLLVLPTIESQTIGLLYIIIFGLGSIGGMMLMSMLVSLPLYLTALHFNRLNNLLKLFAGLFSICIGLWIIYEKGFADKPII